MTTRLADAIFQRLAREVDTVFLVPGGGAMYLVDALGLSGLRYVAMLHEQGAGYAALAYAQIHGFGVCLVTSGPGSTNAVTPCAAAWTDSVPVLFISGQANSTSLIGSSGLRTRGVQEIDIIPVVEPITKWACRIDGPRTAGNVIEHAIRVAMDGRRGPVWVDVPMDLQAVEVEG